jgi:hypothetical protein
MNHCCHGRATSITYWSVCACVHACGYLGACVCACTYVHVALLIQHAMSMHHIVTSVVAPWSVPHFLTSNKWCAFWKKVIEHKMRVFIFSTTFYHSKKKLVRYCQTSWNVFMCITCYTCWIWMKLDFSWQIFKKSWNVKFHQNSFNGGWVVPHGQTYGQMDMTKLTDASHNFANLPKKTECLFVVEKVTGWRS